MLASNTFDKILQEIQTSNLNFQLQVSPFSAQISLKKSLVEDKNGCLRLPSTASYEPCKDSKLKALESRAYNLEKELEDIRSKYEQTVDYLEEANERIKTLEDLVHEPIK